MENFKIIIVEDVPLELKGTEGIIRNDIPEAEIIGCRILETDKAAVSRPRVARPRVRRLYHCRR